MLKQCAVGIVLALLALPAAAIECLSSTFDASPILVFKQVSSSIDGIDSSALQRTLRDRLNASGKYRVLLPDQYAYAEKNRQIDRCTPAFAADVQVQMQNSDAGASYGFRGLVTRSDFTAQVSIARLPEQVTLDEFSLTEKANTFIAGTAANKAFDRLLNNIENEFETRRDNWVHTKTPGL